MSDYAVSECPKCKKLVVILVGEEGYDLDWQYLCTCGAAFAFKEKDDESDS